MASGSGRNSGQRDLGNQLFGPGALKEATNTQPRSGSTRRAEPSSRRPIWVRLATATVATGAASWGLDDLLPLLPAGGSRDTLRETLGAALAYAPTATGVLSGCTACAFGLWWRSPTRRRTPRDTPTAADRAAATALKLRPDALRVTLNRHAQPRIPRRIKKVTVTYPAGALTQDPSRTLAAALTPVVGTQVRPERWDSARGRVVLLPGPLPEPEPEPPAEASNDPVRRAQQSLASILGKIGDESQPTVLATHEDETPKEFIIRHNTTAKTASEENQKRVSEWLSNMLPESRGGRGWRVTVEPHLNQIRCEDKKAMPNRILHPGDVRGMTDSGLILPVGQDENENPLGFDISPKTIKPHGVIVGPTGTGKTSLFRSVIAAASQYGVEMWGADPKRIEMLGFTEWPGFTSLAVNVDTIRSLIRAAHKEMNARYKKIENREARRTELPPLMLLMDELLVLRSMLIFAWKQEGGKGDPPELTLLIEMIVMARSARLHLWFGVQRPDAELLDKGARDSLRFRASLGQLSPEGAYMMWEDRSIGVTPTTVAGRGLATGIDGRPTEMQAWWTADLDPHPYAREELSPEERERVDLLRNLASAPEASGSWSITTSGLAVPDSDSAADRSTPPRGGAEEAMADVIDVRHAREISDDLPVRAKIERSDSSLEYVTIERAERTCDDEMELEIKPDGASGETIAVEPDEMLWIVGYELTPV